MSFAFITYVLNKRCKTPPGTNSILSEGHHLSSSTLCKPTLSYDYALKRVDVALRDMFSGHGGDGLMVGSDDLSGLFQHL